MKKQESPGFSRGEQVNELTPLDCYSPRVKADAPDPRLHVLARRLPDWPTDDLADLLAELDEAVTL